MAKVTLFRFQIYDAANDTMKTSKRWGTREAIDRIHGEVVEDSEIEVDTPRWEQIDGLTEKGWEPNQSQGFQTSVLS